jgi:integrase
MKQFSLNGVTGSVIFDNRKIKNNNKYPVKYRITYNRKQYYISSGIDLTEEEWTEILAESRKKSNLKVRGLLNTGFDRVERAIEDLFKQDNTFSFNLVLKFYKRGNKKTLSEFFERKILELEARGQVGSAEAYTSTMKSIFDFVRQKVLLPIDITPDFLKTYEQWMLYNKKSYASIGIYLRQLRAILNIARRDLELNDLSYPFGKGKYEIPNCQGVKKALTLKQIKDVISYKAPKNSKAEMYRDLWFFSYLCNGMNVHDICKLKYSNIKDGEIVFIRNKTSRTSKTKKLISVPLLKETKSIINKWGNDEDPDNYIFPFLTDDMKISEEKAKVKIVTKSINTCLHRIGIKNKIGKITTYSARHSYASVLKRSGANLAYISDSLGHSDLKTTEAYLASFEKDQRRKNAMLLTKF